MLTVYSKSQVSENKICFTQDEVDYFVNQDIKAKFLIIDTTLKNIKYRQCDSINKVNEQIIISLKSNELDLKSILVENKNVVENYKVELLECKNSNNSKNKWNKIYKKIIIGSISIIIIESCLIYLFAK